MMTPNRKPYKIRWSRLFLCMSLVAMVVGGVFSNASYFWHLSLWTHRIGLRDELWMKDGSLVITRFSPVKLQPDGKVWYEVESRDPVRFFARQRRFGEDPWQGETIGFRVDQRYRLLGFEYATGEYIPPFSWQHPWMPFRGIKVPLVALFLIGSVYPTVRFFLRYQKNAGQKRFEVSKSTDATSDGPLDSFVSI